MNHNLLLRNSEKVRKELLVPSLSADPLFPSDELVSLFHIGYEETMEPVQKLGYANIHPLIDQSLNYAVILNKYCPRDSRRGWVSKK